MTSYLSMVGALPPARSN